MTQLSILQANFWRLNQYPLHDHGVLLKQGADLIGVNEGKDFLRLFRNSPGYHAAIPHTKGPRQQNPVLVSDRVRFLKFTAHDMCSRVGKSPARAATVVYYELDGQRRAHVVTHANAHIEKSGRPRNLPRVAQNVIHMRRLARLVRRLRKAGWKVTVAGDFNWDYSYGKRGWFYSPKRVFNRLGMACNWADRNPPKGGSHGSRQIDYIAYFPDDLVLVKQGWVRGEHSDHRWLLATFRVKGK